MTPGPASHQSRKQVLIARLTREARLFVVVCGQKKHSTLTNNEDSGLLYCKHLQYLSTSLLHIINTPSTQDDPPKIEALFQIVTSVAEEVLDLSKATKNTKSVTQYADMQTKSGESIKSKKY